MEFIFFFRFLHVELLIQEHDGQQNDFRYKYSKLLKKSLTNFVQIDFMESATPTAMWYRSWGLASSSSNSKDTVFKALRITGTAAFTCFNCRLWIETKTETRKDVQKADDCKIQPLDTHSWIQHQVIYIITIKKLKCRYFESKHTTRLTKIIPDFLNVWYISYFSVQVGKS